MILQQFLKKENTSETRSKDIYIECLNISKKFLNTDNLLKYNNYKSSFEIVSILIIFNLKIMKDNKIEDFKNINQYLINTFINDLDESLRAKGIGDMSIGKYVKSYVKKFYFRLSLFEKNDGAVNLTKINSYLKQLDFIEDKNIEIVSEKLLITYNKLTKSSILN